MKNYNIKIKTIKENTISVKASNKKEAIAKVKVNDLVKQGQQIASVGTTGYSTGNHLHYQVELNGNPIDGLSLIDFTINASIPPFTPNLPNRDI